MFLEESDAALRRSQKGGLDATAFCRWSRLGLVRENTRHNMRMRCCQSHTSPPSDGSGKATFWGCGFGVRRWAGTEEGWDDGERVEMVGRERGRREESEAGGTRSEGFKG